ncbi:head-tail connector protein [Edwardsiella piscicida]|uniref:head-tail connector protein n=1 Tax=Edwardsiella piscicida TaxID=1263550 RepID=UPI00370D1518
MMPTLDELRQQCRIDDKSEDALLMIYAGAAKVAAETFLNRSLVTEGEDISGDALPLTPDIKLALMMMVGHWYTNREAVSPEQLMPVPFSYRALLEPYRFKPL